MYMYFGMCINALFRRATVEWHVNIVRQVSMARAAKIVSTIFYSLIDRRKLLE